MKILHKKSMTKEVMSSPELQQFSGTCQCKMRGDQFQPSAPLAFPPVTIVNN